MTKRLIRFCQTFPARSASCFCFLCSTVESFALHVALLIGKLKGKKVVLFSFNSLKSKDYLEINWNTIIRYIVEGKKSKLTFREVKKHFLPFLLLLFHDYSQALVFAAPLFLKKINFMSGWLYSVLVMWGKSEKMWINFKSSTNPQRRKRKKRPPPQCECSKNLFFFQVQVPPMYTKKCYALVRSKTLFS